MTSPLKDHWNRIYTNTPVPELGWYEARPSPSLELIERCAISRRSSIADIGSGASTLIPHLLELGYLNIHAVDISKVALEKAKNMLGKERAARVHWMVDDICNPSTVLKLQDVAIWHDRAVFHFLTKEADRQTYFSVLNKVIMPGSFLIMAAFAIKGAEKCSGLPVKRYRVEDLCEFFGSGFRLIENLDHIYRMPSSDLRPYVYTRFQKNQSL